MQVLSDPVIQAEGNSSDRRRFALTPAELVLAGKAVAIARREIDEVEFHTRLGADIASADDFLASVVSATLPVPDEVQRRRSSPATLGPEDCEAVVTLDLDELSLVNNALNEIVNGLREEDSADLDEEDRADARRLLRTVNDRTHEERRKARVAATGGDHTVDLRRSG